jgi:hypothetical protein
MDGNTFEGLVQELVSDYTLIELDWMSKNPMKYINTDAIEYDFWESILREALYLKKKQNN